MSRLGFDEQGRALEQADQETEAEADPLKLAAKAQSASVQAAIEVIGRREATPEAMPELLHEAIHLPDPAAVLLDGPAPVWDQWIAALEGAHLDLAARRDLVTLSTRLPEAQRIGVLERVFRVPIGADARAVDAVDDLLEDAAGQPIPDEETEEIELDAALQLTGPEAVLEGLFEPAPAADALVDQHTPDAQVALGGEGVERRVDVVGFVRACAPGIAGERAVGVLSARFGGGPPMEDEPAWWGQVARLRRRFPALVDALEAARDGAPQGVAVRGGFARVDLAAGTLGIYAPASAEASRA